MLKQFDAGQRNFGFIEGTRGYIVSDNDFCHLTLALDALADLNICGSGSELYKSFTLEEIRALAVPVTSFQKWAHYWGIKGRIRQNYNGLLKSMREIGASTEGMPEWGEEPQVKEAQQC